MAPIDESNEVVDDLTTGITEMLDMFKEGVISLNVVEETIRLKLELAFIRGQRDGIERIRLPVKQDKTYG